MVLRAGSAAVWSLNPFRVRAISRWRVQRLALTIGCLFVLIALFRDLGGPPIIHVITAVLPSSFQVPVIPSPRVAFAAPSLDKVISKGCPDVSLTFHTPSNALAARVARVF